LTLHHNFHTKVNSNSKKVAVTLRDQGYASTFHVHPVHFTQDLLLKRHKDLTGHISFKFWTIKSNCL